MPDAFNNDEQAQGAGPADRRIEAALAAAYGPDSTVATAAARSVADALGGVRPAPDPASCQAPCRPFIPPRVRSFGDYELLEEIAQGGMGVVYKARQTSLSRTVAIKLILSGHLASEEDIQRFRAEAEAAANLRHPRIVAVHEVGVHDDQHYFSMDYVEGRSLADILRAGPRSPQIAARYVRDIAEAVDHAHQQGTLHRDLKPSNILVDAHEQVHITDFGLATRVHSDSRMTRAGQVLGTPAYMSPEQAEAKRGLIGPASDVYALGVILYECLTGQAPFRAKTPLETLQQVVSMEPASPRLHNPAVPRDLEAICRKCLQKRPHQRYHAAAQLADDLNRYLSGAPILARPISRLARLWRWIKRQPAVAGFYATALVLLLTLAIGGPLVAWRESALRNRAENLAVQSARLADENVELAKQESLKRAEADAHRARSDQTARELRAKRLRLDHALYANRIALAEMEWRTGNVARTRELLDLCPPHLRHWEWAHLKHKCELALLTLTGHSGRVNCVAYSPDGLRIVTAGHDRVVRLWDAQTGSQLQAFHGHTDAVSAVAFSPDGRQIATASYDATVKLWDAANGSESRTFLGHHDRVYSLAFCPDGRRIASVGRDRIVRLWNVETGAQTAALHGHDDCLIAVAWSAAAGAPGRIASAGYDRTVRVWDAETGATLLIFRGHRASVGDVAFSPDGRQIVSVSRDRSVKVWNAETSEEQLTFNRPESWVIAVAFSSNGQRIACGSSDSTVTIRDAMTGQEVLALRGHTSHVADVAFSPDDQQIVSANYDGTAKLWDALSDRTSLTFRGHEGWLTSVVFSPDGRWIASASDNGTMQLRDAESGRLEWTMRGHQGRVWDVAFDPQGTRIASCAAVDNSVKISDARSGQELLTLHGHQNGVNSVAFSPDGRWIASASSDRTVKVWDAEFGGELQTFRGHRRVVYDVAFSPDGRRIAAAGLDRTVRVWDVETGRLTLTLRGHKERVLNVAFSPDGRQIASASEDHTVRLWDAVTGQSVLTLRGHNRPVYAVAFSPDGHRIASGGQDNSVKLWDAQMGHETLTLRGHSDLVGAVAFSPDGRRIASAGIDGVVKIWEAWHLATFVPIDIRESDSFSERQGSLLEVAAAQSRIPDASIDYRLRIGTPGEYQLYLRWDGHDSASDSIFARVVELSDGPGGDVADWYQFSAARERDGDFATNPWRGLGGLESTDATIQPVPAVWRIPKPGDYTVRLEMREDGTAVDALVFQLVQLTPPTGDGPPESNVSDEPTYVEVDGRVVVEGEHFSSARPGFTGAAWRIISAGADEESHYRNARGDGCIQVLPDRGEFSIRIGRATDYRDVAARFADEAWKQMSTPGPAMQDSHHIVLLARKAVALEPVSAYQRTTLGAALFRAGEYTAAREELLKAEELGSGAHFGMNGLFLAMTCRQLRDFEQAREWFGRSLAWIEQNRADAEKFQPLIAEARSLIERGDL